MNTVDADLRAVGALLTALPEPETEAAAVDRIRYLEELKAACAATQARATSALYGLRVAAEAADGVPARERGRGVAAEVALARRESPSTGSRDVGLARALCEEMPHTMAALTRGAISEWKATIMCRETAWLPVEDRRLVDEAMAGRLEELGVKKLAGEARAHAQRLDQASAVAQMERSARERRVSVRPAPGGMAYLTALLPMAQAVSCLGSLKRSAATAVGTGEAADRTQDQIVADLLVERATGQDRARDVPVEIHLVMTDRSLWGGGTGAGGDFSAGETPAWLVGHGPLPADVARKVVADSEAEAFIRRLYTEPTTGQLTALDSRRRTFDGALRRLILVRDDTCRTPYCDAPIKHVDHVTPYRDGGSTTASNASGLCARCNYAKENPSWSHDSDGDLLSVTTPTGHRYAARTGPLVSGSPPGRGVPPGRGAPPGAGPPPEKAGPPPGTTPPPESGSMPEPGSPSGRESHPRSARSVLACAAEPAPVVRRIPVVSDELPEPDAPTPRALAAGPALLATQDPGPGAVPDRSGPVGTGAVSTGAVGSRQDTDRGHGAIHRNGGLVWPFVWPVEWHGHDVSILEQTLARMVAMASVASTAARLGTGGGLYSPPVCPVRDRKDRTSAAAFGARS